MSCNNCLQLVLPVVGEDYNHLKTESEENIFLLILLPFLFFPLLKQVLTL